MAHRGEPGNAHTAAARKNRDITVAFRRPRLRGDRGRRQDRGRDTSKDSLDRREFLAAMAAVPAMAKIQHTELTV